jgi:hypothetical protein
MLTGINFRILHLFVAVVWMILLLPLFGSTSALGRVSQHQWLVGDWLGNDRDTLAFRTGNCVLKDVDLDGEEQCYGDGEREDEYLVGDWNGDGTDNLAVRRGACVLMDTNFDNTHDKEQCYGNGNAEDEYLVGDWNGDGTDNLAVRRDACVLMDTNFDNTHDKEQCYGNGNAEDEYLVGNWNGDEINTRDKLAVRRDKCVLKDINFDHQHDEEQCYPPILFRGICDGSAAVGFIVSSTEERIVVGNDDEDTLRLYAVTGGAPINAEGSLKLDAYLKQDKPNREADIEGATWIFDTVYWIGSHGRSSDGEWRTERQLFFAIARDPIVSLRPLVQEDVTGPVNLIDHLLAYDNRFHLGLAQAIGKGNGKDEELAPEAKGLNIEALAYDPERRWARIGLRNPRPNGKALVISFVNPDGVVARGEAPQFGDPLLFDFEGLGIRDMAYSNRQRSIFLLVGPVGGGRPFRLYRWGGVGDPILIRRIDDITPEAIVPLSNSGDLLLLSDDGDDTLMVEASHCEEGKYADGRCACKHLTDKSQRLFRARQISLD